MTFLIPVKPNYEVEQNSLFWSGAPKGYPNVTVSHQESFALSVALVSFTRLTCSEDIEGVKAHLRAIVDTTVVNPSVFIDDDGKTPLAVVVWDDPEFCPAILTLPDCLSLQPEPCTVMDKLYTET